MAAPLGSQTTELIIPGQVAVSAPRATIKERLRDGREQRNASCDTVSLVKLCAAAGGLD